MYTVIGANRLIRIMLYAFALVVLVGVYAYKTPSLREIPDFASTAAGIFTILIAAVFGTSFYYSPWRILWRAMPRLNSLVFPDLNGTWVGETQSNWPVIQLTRKAAVEGGGIRLEELAETELQKGRIVIQIWASLFWITVTADVQATNGNSESILATLKKNPKLPEYTLSYLYRQNTPEPASTDEDSHVGAATLKVKFGTTPRMTGPYWTRRKWREGMNTAGLIEVIRKTDRHTSDTSLLLRPE